MSAEYHVSRIPEGFCQKFVMAVDVRRKDSLKDSLVVVFGENSFGSEWIGSVDELQKHLAENGVATALDSDGHLVKVESGAQASYEPIAA